MRYTSWTAATAQESGFKKRWTLRTISQCSAPSGLCFLTHLHSDHVVDYPNLLLYGWLSGLDRAASALKIFGPGRRGEMEPIFALPANSKNMPKVVNPRNPTPGTRDMTE